MSGFWGINAAKQRNELVPGSSKWTANELGTVNNLVLTDAEQFAYSITTELTWINEHMHDVLTSMMKDDNSPKDLLLKSPTKLQDVKESPIKKIRHNMLQLPFSHHEINQSNRLSPIKLDEGFAPLIEMDMKSDRTNYDKEQITTHTNGGNVFLDKNPSEMLNQNNAPLPFNANLSFIPVSQPNYDMLSSEVDSNTSFQDKTSKLDSTVYTTRSNTETQKLPLKSDSTSANIEKAHYHRTPRSARTSAIGFASLPVRDPIIVKSNKEKRAKSKETAKPKPKRKESIRQALQRLSTSGSPARMRPKSNGLNLSLEKSYAEILTSPTTTKSYPRLSSTYRKQNSIPSKVDRSPSRSHRLESLSPVMPYSENKYPSKYSEGSQKVERLLTANKDFEMELNNSIEPPIHQNIKSMSESMKDSHNSTDSQNNSSMRFSTAPQQIKENSVNNELTPKKETVLKQASPMQSIFASVGSTIRRAKSLFSDKSPVHKPEETKPAKQIGNNGPTKDVKKEEKQDVFSRLAAPTEASIAKSATRGPKNYAGDSPLSKRYEGNNKLLSVNLNPVNPPKFSQNRSPYAGLRQQLNKTSPSKKTYKLEKSESVIDKDKENRDFKGPTTVPVLKRMSLLNELRQNQHQVPSQKQKQKVRVAMSSKRELERKTLVNNSTSSTDSNKAFSSNTEKQASVIDQSGTQINSSISHHKIANIKETPKSDNKVRMATRVIPPVPPIRSIPKSSKRKTQEESELQTGKQVPYKSQDNKRRKTNEPSERSQGLEKKASRVSANKFDSHTQLSKSSQDMLKTAMIHSAKIHSKLPHQNGVKIANDRIKFGTAGDKNNLINSNKNVFQSGAVSKLQNRRKHTSSSSTKKSTVLPEIFSESDDDDEGTVLKDWANSPELKSLLLKQQGVDPDQIFGPIAPLQMDDIFNSRLSKFRGRGSSAQWTGQDMLTAQEIEQYALEMGYKNNGN